MFVATDMGAYFRSTDHGTTWRVMEFGFTSTLRSPVGFDPTDSQRLFLLKCRRIWRSLDAGKTWKEVHRVKGGISCDIVIDPADPKRIWVGMKRDNYVKEPFAPITTSVDGGDTWEDSLHGIPGNPSVNGLHLDLTSPPAARRLIAATAAGVFVSKDSGATWTKDTALPNGEVLSMAGYSSDTQARCIVFVAVKGKGVYSSTDSGATWRAVNTGLPGGGKDCRKLAMARSNSQIVYAVCGLGQIFRSNDRGHSWSLIHNARKDNIPHDWVTEQLGASWNGNIHGICVNPGNPDEFIFTDSMRCCRTLDGGKSWHPLHTRKLEGGGYSQGVPITVSTGIFFAPDDPQRMYYTCHDVGYFWSSDGGKSWHRTVEGIPYLWWNTCYQLVVDPAETAVLYGAFSRQHGIPNTIVSERSWKGGICKSTDRGVTWTPCKDLPEAPTTSVALDLKSDARNRTLYAVLFRHGVYKTTDAGRSWVKKSRGLPEAPHAWRLALHSDGTLLCGITKFWKGPRGRTSGRPPGGLYRSTDGAESWTKIEYSPAFDHLMDVAMDPRSSSTIYVSSWGRSGEGGLYKTTDGGKSWRQVVKEATCYYITIDPRRPNTIYTCSLGGGGGGKGTILWSADGGNTWRRITGLPYYAYVKVIPHPTEERTIYLTTYGADMFKTTLPAW
jgi:photosystem II stability/assembly factor-like uncharacterized protein